MSTVLDKKSAVETLIRCVVVGQSKGTYNIKDAALMYRVITFLRGGEDKELEEKNATDALVRAVVLSNSRGAYTLEEAALIDKVVTFLEENGFISSAKQEEPSKEEPTKEESGKKIVEI